MKYFSFQVREVERGPGQSGDRTGSPGIRGRPLGPGNEFPLLSCFFRLRGVGASRRTGQPWTTTSSAVLYAITMRRASCRRWAVPRDTLTTLATFKEDVKGFCSKTIYNGWLEKMSANKWFCDRRKYWKSLLKTRVKWDIKSTFDALECTWKPEVVCGACHRKTRLLCCT